MLDTFLTKFLPMAFATNGLKNNIPVADPAMFSSASYEKGFPQSTMKKVTEGGIPPQGKDFNGILNEIVRIRFGLMLVALINLMAN